MIRPTDIRDLRGVLARGGGERAPRQLGHALVLDRPGHRQHETLRAVTDAVVTAQRLRAQRVHGLHGAQDGLAERVRAPHQPGEQLVDLVLRIVLAREDLLAHHGLLLLHLLLREHRAAHDVREHVDHLGQVLGERAGVVAHLLARGEGVHVAAQRLEALGDRARVAALGALEQHVLDEVGDAEPRARLVARAAAQPHAERQRVAVGHGLGEEREPRGQRALPEGAGGHRAHSRVA